MLVHRPAAARGHANHGWLDSWHTFSFADYYDPAHMGFRDLRVINEDRVAPRQGFGTHGHKDMEIISYVLDGEIEHKDSMGTKGVLKPGEVQRMSAGTGIDHSEFNHSKDALVHLLQIWILPERRGLTPSYEQKVFPIEQTKNGLLLVAARDGRDGAVTVHQDVALYAGKLAAGARIEHPLAPGRHAWLQVARGSVEVSGQKLRAGDGLAASDEAELAISASDDAEVLLFDLA